MLSLLGLALLVGMHHALEADHVAAVSSFASGGKRLPEIVGHGVTWGIGHTVTLFLFAGAALVLDRAIPETLSTRLEVAVGIMLVGLGGHVLWRLWRDRIHFHGHRHDDSGPHFHAHSHRAETTRHEYSPHRHSHRFKWRTLLVGMVHGMAGSAALLLLAVAQVRNAWEGLAYVLLFGFGSILGMAIVSAAIGLPVVLTARSLNWANRSLQLMVGAATMLIGARALLATDFAGW